MKASQFKLALTIGGVVILIIIALILLVAYFGGSNDYLTVDPVYVELSTDIDSGASDESSEKSDSSVSNFEIRFSPADLIVPIEQKREITVRMHAVYLSEAVGTDLVIRFDPEVLEVVDVLEGDMYDLYIGEDIDAENGIIKISGAGQNYSNSDEIAVIVVKRIQAGETELELVTEPIIDDSSEIKTAIATFENNLFIPVATTYTIN